MLCIIKTKHVQQIHILVYVLSFNTSYGTPRLPLISLLWSLFNKIEHKNITVGENVECLV